MERVDLLRAGERFDPDADPVDALLPTGHDVGPGDLELELVAEVERDRRAQLLDGVGERAVLVEQVDVSAVAGIGVAYEQCGAALEDPGGIGFGEDAVEDPRVEVLAQHRGVGPTGGFRDGLCCVDDGPPHRAWVGVVLDCHASSSLSSSAAAGVVAARRAADQASAASGEVNHLPTASAGMAVLAHS